MKYLNPLLIAFLFVGMISCERDTEAKPVQHDILSVAGPATGSVNTDVIFTVTYNYADGCDYIDRFTESKSGNVVTIKSSTKAIPKDAICTQDAGTRTKDYKFKSATAGTFELKFKKTDGSSIDRTIVVQ